MKRIAFLLDGFELLTPGQQLLDRFLIGWNDGGEFHAPPAKVALWLPEAAGHGMVQKRAQDFGLEIAGTPEGASAAADAVIIAPGRKDGPRSFLSALNAVPSGKPCCIDAQLLPGPELAGLRRPVITFTAAAHLIPMPVRPAVQPEQVQKALVTVPGPFPNAEMDGMFALEPYLPSRRPEPHAIRRLDGGEVWNLAYSAGWRALLAAAVSRSSNIKGAPEKDGRTQDVVGLQLLEQLAREPRAWHLADRNGMEILLLALEGAVGDINGAFQDRRGIHSANLNRPPAPMQDHYSALAASLWKRLTAGERADDGGLRTAASAVTRMLA